MKDEQTAHENLYTDREERAHAITHGIGMALSLPGTFFLVLKALEKGDSWHLISFLIFGFSLFLLYLSSTLYHSLPGKEIKNRLRKLDHSAIYLLIAGTYTPFLLTSLRHTTGWVMLFVVWTFALIGILLKLMTTIRSKWVSAIIYLSMGWLAVFIYRSMITGLPEMSLILLGIGGLFYTLGVLFYIWKSLPYHHAIWHVFVLGGSIFHYFSIYFLL